MTKPRDDVFKVRTVTVDGAEIRLVPGWDAEITEGESWWGVEEVTQPHQGHSIPDSADPNGTIAPSFSIYGEGADSPEGLAFMLAAAILEVTLHETMEWIRVDGVPLADPHPKDDRGREDLEMWGWMYEECQNLVERYMEKFPVKAGDYPQEGDPS